MNNDKKSKHSENLKKVIVFDLDGTIIGQNDDLNLVANEMKLHHNEYIYICNTARPRDSVLKKTDKIPVDYLICRNGIEIYNEYGILEEWETLVSEFIESGMTKIIYDRIQAGFNGIVTVPYQNTVNIKINNPETISEMLEIAKNARKSLPFSIINSGSNIRLISDDINKSSALKFILNNTEHEKVISAGNGLNDVEFVKNSDVGFLHQRLLPYVRNFAYNTFDDRDVGYPLLCRMMSENVENNMNCIEKIKHENGKVILQLSGGKDSVACLLMLKESGISFKAIHFVHEWNYQIPTNETIRICKEQDVELKIVDITRELKEVLIGYSGRPCRICKSVMDKKTVEYAISVDANYICTGDSKSDRTLFNRIENADSVYSRQISRYFNKAVELPENISILRPLSEMDNNDVFRYLAERNVVVNRVNDTGDKYYEYSREGCPLQFKDYGVPFSVELMDELHRLNTMCSQFATEKGIRASVHLPSRYIITIPLGNVAECREYLKLEKAEQSAVVNNKHFYVNIQISNNVAEKKDIAEEMVRRFFERLDLKIESSNNLSENFIRFILKNGSANVEIFADENLLNMNIRTPLNLSCGRIEELIREIFHTEFYSVDTAITMENMRLFYISLMKSQKKQFYSFR